MSELTVLGIGNILMGDEGVGVRLLEAVREAKDWPETVEFIDGGVGGLNLLNIIEEARRLIVFDAAEMGLSAGECRTVNVGQLAEEDDTHRLSMHEVPFTETLKLCREFFTAPDDVTILAIQPAVIESTRNLSETIQKKFAELVRSGVDLVEKHISIS